MSGNQKMTKDLAIMAFFAALTAICSQIQIPLPYVPINLALFSVHLCGLLLGSKRAVLSQSVFLLLGLIGLPVFAGFKGGPGVLFGKTGGYIIGYLLCALIDGLIAGKDEASYPRMMLQMLAEKLGPKVFYMEVSHLSQKMLGYKLFRENRFFPVRWMSIHNSLHSRAPEERISERKLRRINQAYERGIITDEVQSDADFEAFMRLLRHHNWLKPKRYIPHENFFQGLRAHGYGRLFVTRYHDHIIGCSACVYSEGQAYLWYAAYRRKTYAFLHPKELTIWHAIKDAHSRGYEHIYFMDVGLPFRKNAFREFILRFGGKPVSTYRWFRFRWKWLNKLLSWLYRD